MVQKNYDWENGAELGEHSKAKHKVVKEYFFEYMIVRCKNRKQSHFKLAIIDGFSGGGRYQCGSEGSPIIFMEQLKKSIEAISLERAIGGGSNINFTCLFIFNDLNKNAIKLLKENLAPSIISLRELKNLTIDIVYLSEYFDAAYPKIKNELISRKITNTIFNLDQCGYKHVNFDIIRDIIKTFRRPEIFYTFLISSLIAYLRKTDQDFLKTQLKPFGIELEALDKLTGSMDTAQWLGAAERIVFYSLQSLSKYVSPFAINNPSGWRYWLIHFATEMKARKVYNDILYVNHNTQVHSGKAGLTMLSYDSRIDIEKQLGLFDKDHRSMALDSLRDDIPRLIADKYNGITTVDNFLENEYNFTSAHSDDINTAFFDNGDTTIRTADGGERLKSHTIKTSDIIELKRQISFHFMKKNKKKEDA